MPRVERLGRQHRISEFRSGEESLDRWLRSYAGQSDRKDSARTFVHVGDDGAVSGFYALVVGSILHESATAGVKAGMPPRFPIPVCLIARLAVDRNHQGRGVGRTLLRDALRRIDKASQDVAIRAVVVDAIGEPAAAFYQRYGFEPLTHEPLTLMIPLAAVRSVLSKKSADE